MNRLSMPTPRFAILSRNTLMGLGLKSLLERILPTVEVMLFSSIEELKEEERNEHFFHYFIENEILELEGDPLRDKLHRTIRLTRGEEVSGHSLNICQSEAEIVRDVMRIRHCGHPTEGHGASRPKPEKRLTPREADVLRLLAKGHINKEIADRLGVGITTVISHRRNLTRKLGIRTVSALTIYAMMNGYINEQ